MSRADNGLGTVSISIDLELAIGEQPPERQQRLEDLTASLLEALEGASLPATWAVSNPALSAATDAILAARTRHEIAVLGDCIWLGNGTTSTRLDQEFARRFDEGQRRGLEISTLCLRQDIGQELGLNSLLKHGISAIRGSAGGNGGGQGQVRPDGMRYGVWCVDHPIHVPIFGSWWGAQRWDFGQRLRNAVHRRQPLHLVVDASRMAARADLGLPRVLATIRSLAELQAAGLLQVKTLHDLARENLSRRASRPSRSVLAA